MWSICAQTHRQRRTCLQHGHVRDRVQEGPACVLFAQWYLYALVCHSGRVCVFMWVCSVGVKGHCVGGHQELCEGCCFEVGWERISRKGQGEKVLWQSPNIIPHITVCLPQLGPRIDPHINTTWPPHYNTDPHAHTRFSHIHSRPLGYRVHKPEEAGEQGARSMRYLFDQHGDVAVMVSLLWPLPLCMSRVRGHGCDEAKHTTTTLQDLDEWLKQKTTLTPPWRLTWILIFLTFSYPIKPLQFWTKIWIPKLSMSAGGRYSNIQNLYMAKKLIVPSTFLLQKNL